MCHAKATKSKQLTDTLQISHKHITNLTITHTDKLMNAIFVCAVILRGVARGKAPHELQDAQQILELTGRKVSKNASAMDQRAAQHVSTPLRVQHTTTQRTLSVTAAQAPAPRLEPTLEQTATGRGQRQQHNQQRQCSQQWWHGQQWWRSQLRRCTHQHQRQETPRQCDCDQSNARQRRRQWMVQQDILET